MNIHTYIHTYTKQGAAREEHLADKLNITTHTYEHTYLHTHIYTYTTQGAAREEHLADQLRSVETQRAAAFHDLELLSTHVQTLTKQLEIKTAACQVGSDS